MRFLVLEMMNLRSGCRPGSVLAAGPQRGSGDGNARHPGPAGRAGGGAALRLPLLLGAGGGHLPRRAGPVLGPGAGGGGGADGGRRGAGRPPPQRARVPRLQALCRRPGPHLQPAPQTPLPRVPQGERVLHTSTQYSVLPGKYSGLYVSVPGPSDDDSAAEPPLRPALLLLHRLPELPAPPSPGVPPRPRVRPGVGLRQADGGPGLQGAGSDRRPPESLLPA